MYDHSSCIIREVPLPQREYRVSPPERWENAPRRSRPSGRRRRRFRILPVLLALSLVFSFLLGRASASKARAGTPSVVMGLQKTQETASPPPAQSESAAGTPAAILPVPTAGTDASLSAPDAASSQGAVSLEPGTSPEPDTGAAEQTPADPAAWNLLLVNGEHPLPEDFRTPELTQLANGHAFDTRAYPALQEMMDAAKAAGVHPTICSSFRTQETQERLYRNKIARLRNAGWDPDTVEQEAARWVARPGTSEHQTGLAVDIVDKAYQSLTSKQASTAAQKWLMEHCWEYGFILRYPSDKESLTGVGYEPWHYRYVGKAAAQAIMSRGICLEEYIAECTETP